MSSQRLAHDHPYGWVPLENRFYSRNLVYSSLPWSLTAADLTTSFTAIAPQAGPIASVPDAGWGLHHSLSIHSLSAQLIRCFDRLRQRTVPPFRAVSLGWSRDDLLSIVYNDGVLIRIPGGLHLEDARFVTICDASKDRIHDSTVLFNGHVVARTSSGCLYHIDPQDNVSCDQVTVAPPECATRQLPNAGIAAIASDVTHHGVEVLLIRGSGNVVLVSSSNLFDMPGQRDVEQIVLSPDGLYVASLEASSGHLSVSTANLRSEIARINLVLELSVLAVENIHSDTIFDPKKPETMCWVGSDAIAVLYREHIILVGPHGGIAVLPLREDAIHGGIILQTERDGMRLISSSLVEFIQMVPESLSSVLCHEQALNYKLLKSSLSLDLDTTSGEALTRYRLLRELRETGSLLEAARGCVAAAYLETDAERQKQMIAAAAFGLRFASVFPDKVQSSAPALKSQTNAISKRRNQDRSRRDVNMVPTAIAVLRVLHSASSLDAGVPLTKPQFDILGLPSLVQRLSRYGKHTLAIRLSSFGGISPHDVLSEWAATAVRSNQGETDEVITSFITERFESIMRSYTALDLHGSARGRALPYVKAAEAAYSCGRTKCAELLLRRETRPAPKVAMYLKMGREGPAIVAAVSSGDSELVLDALGTILQTKSVRETARLLRSLPSALSNRVVDLFAAHLKQIGDLNSLKWLYLEIGRRREAALVDIYRANRIEDSQAHLSELEKAVASMGRGQTRRACHFEAQALQHAIGVASNAIEVEKRGKLEPGTLRYANDGDLLARAILDITDTTRRQDMLDRLRRELKMPDRRFFWVCLYSMAEAGDFKGIEALSHSAGYGKPPPIGLSAFVDTCIKYRMDNEAVKYALRVADLRDRARALARCGHGREAADIASRLRNQQLLEEVQDLAARHVAQISAPLNPDEDGPSL